MVQSIPVQDIVRINPGVIGAGSNPLALNGVLLGQNVAIPVGQILNFGSADEAGAWFGTESLEYELARVYFNGYDNALLYPTQLKMYAWAETERGAWARGTSLRGMTLTELQAVTGTLTVTINGTGYNAAGLDLSEASGFTSAATLIQTALAIDSVATVTWDADTARFIMTVTATPGTSEISQITGTAAEALGFASAILSQGSPVTSLTDTLNTVKDLDRNWAIASVIEDLTMDQMTELAQWSNAQNSRFMVVISDNNPNALINGNQTSFGPQAKLVNYDGVICIYDNNEQKLLKAFVCSVPACVNWSQLNGRTNLAFRTQSGLQPTVVSKTNADALLANGYTYYGRYASSGPDNVYNIIYDGKLPGPFAWFDTFMNQVFLNSQLEKALFVGLMEHRSLPYNAYGRAVIADLCTPALLQAINNGTIRIGVSISVSQKAAIIQTTGVDITRELTDNGYFLQILDATPEVRAQRGSPPINLFYMDGQSVQRINMPSIVVL